MVIDVYSNTEEGAFASIEYIMRDVDYGWIIRYMHTTGASMFFAIVYLHVSWPPIYPIKNQRNLFGFWSDHLFGNDAEGFLGYVLPYGQMSYWEPRLSFPIGAIYILVNH